MAAGYQSYFLVLILGAYEVLHCIIFQNTKEWMDSCLVTFAFIDLAENLQYNIQD